ncbi:MAG: radical SAM protein [Rhodocyclaceae bacterium]|nr:radical SAM protein [Rhodocyclaceae bacterium]
MGLIAAVPAALNDPDTLPAALRERTPIVYGAGSAGRHLLRLFDEMGIAVACCIDANAAQIGAIGPVKVLPPDALGTIADPERHVLIVSINSDHAFETISADIARRYPALGQPLRARSITEALATERCLKRLRAGQPLDLRDCMGCRPDAAQCTAFRRGAERAAPAHPLAPPAARPARINDFAYFITNRCTLNCTHCVEALPHYDKHHNDSAAAVLATVARMVDACGFVHRFSLTGGEVLLHKELAEILRGLLAMPGIGFIYVYTSGTVAPKADVLALLANPRIVVNVSDYGVNTPPRLRANFDAFLSALAAHAIAHTVLPNKVWLDMGRFEELHLDAAAMRASFAKCAFTHCMTLSQGVLYRCPHQLAGVQQGHLPALPDQVVAVDALSDEDLIDHLNRFAARDYIDACGRCKLSASPQEVPAALQSPRRKTIRLALAPTPPHTP